MFSLRQRLGRGGAALAVALGLALLSVECRSAERVIVYPPDGAFLAEGEAITLRGFRPASGPSVATVAGKSGTQSVPLASGLFTVTVQLAPGESVLTAGGQSIKVYVGGKAAEAPSAYAAPDAHAVDNGCEECHSFAGGAQKLREKPPALCLRCHDDVLKGKDGKPLAAPHPPAEEGDCLACHAPHGRALKGLSPAARRELCFGCHDDFTGGGKKRMHAPVAKGECTGCHAAHAAPEKKLLPATGVKLCLLCHADPSRRKDGSEWPAPHPALDDGCPSCHLPHVAEAPRLLKKPQPEVCADCHDPFPTEAGGKSLEVHSPVAEGECGGCHAVHGADEAKLLAAAGKALCEKCHDDPTRAPGGAAWATEHPALDDGCFTCHQPHVAPASGLLKREQAPLCFECHDAFAAPGAGGSVHMPVAKGNCAGCHAPHGSAAGKLLLSSPGRELCLKCHKDPAAGPRGEALPVPHPALDDGCPACHVPHAAPAPRLLAKPQPLLCAGCHEDKNLNAGGEPWATQHPPVAEGLCNSCHAPHGGGQKSLLVKPQFELCGTCHAEVHEKHRVATLDPATGQPAKQGIVLPQGFPVRRKDGALGCGGCHQAHGSDFPKLWNREELQFCVQCHVNL